MSCLIDYNLILLDFHPVDYPASKLTIPGTETSLTPMHDPTPLYHRIYLALREDILNGAFSFDAPMPSEIELASRFGVSRVTLRRTLERLDAEGLIKRARGRGTFAQRQPDARATRADIRGLVENLLAMGLRTEVTVLEFSYDPMPLNVARAMKQAPDTTAQRAVRLRSYEGKPFSYATTHVREDIGRSYDREAMADTSLLRLIERAGAQITGAKQSVSATAADRRVGDLLGVDVGAPLLAVTRVVFDQDGQGLEHIRALYRPDMYEFELDLTPSVGPGGTQWSASA